ncbi:MAG: hypothetical protein WCA16_16965, partial [Candidatus Sulfotelmatobacter sp.]
MNAATSTKSATPGNELNPVKTNLNVHQFTSRCVFLEASSHDDGELKYPFSKDSPTAHFARLSLSIDGDI